ncbi:MAG: Gfo/Idh/MocA family oxidoreductase [Verrucomicrobiae bacterium]|nr:Gfo/Idh/MocA family oxidoreductase [Verrucomicrobiae bacterium]
MANALGFGILGAGMIAPFHAKSVKASQGGRLVAFCDMAKDRVEKISAEYDVKAYTLLDDMLKDPEVHVVNVCLPNHLHHAAVIKCAAAGRHVLTEKPPAMTLRETDDMIAACRRANVKFGCTVQCRVREAIQAIRTAIAQGRFGKLLHADAYMKWFRSVEYYHSEAWRSSRKSGAGVTVQHAFHYVDLLQYLMGPAKRVQARMDNLAHPDVRLEDTLLAFVDFQNGAQGVVQASTALWPGTDIRIEVNGVDGTAIVVGERMTTWKFREDRPEDEAIRRLGDAAQATGASSPTALGFADHGVVVQDMIDAVNTNREVVIPVSSVRPTLEMVLAMYQSAAKRQPVDLPVIDDDSIWEM